MAQGKSEVDSGFGFFYPLLEAHLIDLNQFFDSAIKAKERAYAPFSQFRVGAAILTKNGRTFSGSNIEISSYSLTICAERVAIFRAFAEGEREFEAVAISTSTQAFCPPCGACRQVLWELAGDIDVYLVVDKSTFQKFLLSELLPRAFDQGFFDK